MVVAAIAAEADVKVRCPYLQMPPLKSRIGASEECEHLHRDPLPLWQSAQLTVTGRLDYDSSLQGNRSASQVFRAITAMRDVGCGLNPSSQRNLAHK